ncbi:hypothetical protein K0U00_00780 [Paenibacillus sepulcri]|uniref:Integrase n=1 Tax=Paenibacillus sepulcri TaxID=359917 RepID=A0ABS7BVF5_9BACL|nr:hypothetical protein [Paenibacillus sepulcri]
MSEWESMINKSRQRSKPIAVSPNKIIEQLKDECTHQSINRKSVSKITVKLIWH